jgi:hypothetical protein
MAKSQALVIKARRAKNDTEKKEVTTRFGEKKQEP